MVKPELVKTYLNNRVLGYFAQSQKHINEAYQKITSNWQYKNVLDDFVASIDECIDLKNQQIEKGIIIGIGGSNLFCQAVCGLMSLDNFFFLDSLDGANLIKALELLDHWLQHKIKFKIFLISKSGSTLEVIVNFSVILDKFKKNCKNWQDYFVIISDNDSDFAKFALTNNLTFFPIKKNVGGRFSLFTAASMVPLGCIGVDIEKIKNSAKNVIEKFFANSTNDDYENIILQATYKYAAYSAQKNLNNLFIFDQSAYYLGQWYRQLFAESLVKSDKINFVPTVSLAVDLHSMTQLYLAGDDIWWTIFLKIGFQKYSKIDVVNLFMDNKLKYLDYQNILFSSVCEAFEEQKRSYTILNCSNEESIGQICVSWILEVLLLSIVFKVNPFDQPAVEYYKKNIYKKLKK